MRNEDKVLQAVARGWCHSNTSDRIMDVDLAEAIAEEVLPLIQRVDAPHLGMATTGQLLAELRARIEVDYLQGGGGLDYTTTGGRP